MYARLGVVFLLTAFIPPLILDGQTFTNALIAMALVLASVATAMVGVRRAKVGGFERRLCGWIVFGGACLAIGFLAILPREYAYQKTFNRRMEEIRRKNLEAVERASSAAAATNTGNVACSSPSSSVPQSSRLVGLEHVESREAVAHVQARRVCVS